MLLVGFLVGRQSAPSASTPPTTGSAADRYAEGMAVGRAAGLAEGRAIQLGAPLPAADRQSAEAQFRVGYRAGAEDVFAGYDGGWVIGRPYLVVLSQGVNGLTYRISHREEYVAPAKK